MDDDEAVDVTSMDPEPAQPDEAEDASSMDPEPLRPDEAKDFTSFNPELLQIPKVSAVGLKTRPEHVEGMFKQWLLLPETGKMVNAMLSDFRLIKIDKKLEENKTLSINDVRIQKIMNQTNQEMNSLIANALAGAPINALGNPVNVDAGGNSSSSCTFPGTSAPPLLPRSISSSPHLPEQSNSPLSLGFLSDLAHHPSQELKEQFISRINPFFQNRLRGLLINREKFISINIVISSKQRMSLWKGADAASLIMQNLKQLQQKDALINYWVNGNMLTMDKATQIYNILKHPGREYLTQVDFEPILEEILATHPGFDFLQDMPDSRDEYTKTVIYIIFYKNDRSACGRLTLRNFKRGGDLIDAMQQLDEENDINKVQRYFSYKQVLVINSTFWGLAADDSIKKGDLMAYADYSLNKRVVDRIFSEAPREFTSGVPGKMGYEDFVYFLLSEEDKTTESGIEYWFKCLDLDGNEKITPDEMKYFYEEQMLRMRSMGHGPVVSFEDTLCQIIDMIAPKRQDYITLLDFKRSKLSGNVFNTLFNLRKYIESQRQEKTWLRKSEEAAHPDWTEWDHFVNREFNALHADAEGEDEDED